MLPYSFNARTAASSGVSTTWAHQQLDLPVWMTAAYGLHGIPASPQHGSAFNCQSNPVLFVVYNTNLYYTRCFKEKRAADFYLSVLILCFAGTFFVDIYPSPS